MCLPDDKKSIFGKKKQNKNLFKASNQIRKSKIVTETHFRSLKGPGTKKFSRKDGVRTKAKKKNSFNSLPGGYFHFKLFLDGVSRHTEITRDIKE